MSTLQLLLTLVLCAFALGSTTSHANSQPKATDIGSLRGAKIALPLTDKTQQITYFAHSLTDEQKTLLNKEAPMLNLVVGLTKQEALTRASEAHGIDAHYATPEFLKAANQLHWIQAYSAGVDRYINNPAIMKNERIVLTNCRAVHGPAIADHAMAMLLTLTRNLDFYAKNQQSENWNRGATPRTPIALKGKTMLVIGLGGIGTEIAHRAHGFGMRVIGTRRSDSPSPAFIQKVGKPHELLNMLPEADVVAIAVPLTPETNKLIDAKALNAMKDSAYLINIARGKIVDTNALATALTENKIAGACLDVTNPEPLPKSHPLWKTPNVVLTPHVAWRASLTHERRAILIQENLRRFGTGQPLLNTVNKQDGY
ncbi:D-2-hydroxyacid dehydrogenase [Rubritalea tangerina]|uniref:D-2-hydroxyacid dehydrogenase n=1 Tax=Rubritalea tangerina TaxID=430798 RepID=A0ABW4Z8V3_9BACT